MPASERLREILIEVQTLREREAQALKETTSLLDMLEAVATAAEPQDAMRAFLGEIANSLDAEVVAILRIEEGRHTLVASWPETAKLEPFTPPANLGVKFRTFVDLDAVPAWSDVLGGGFTATRSLLSVPVSHPDGRPGAVACFHTEAKHFSKEDAQLLRRLSRFASQILNALHLSAQNALLAAVIDGSSSGFAIADATDDEMPLVFVNKAFEDMTGYSAAEVLGKNCRFLAQDPSDSPERKRLRQTVKDRGAGHFQLRNRKKSGELFWNDLTLFPVRDDTAQATHLVATQTDATDRVTLEDAQRAAQARLSATLAHTNDAFLLILDGDRVGFSNPALRRLFPAPGRDWAEGSLFAENWAAYLDAIPAAQRPNGEAFLKPDLMQLTRNESGQRLQLPDGKQVLVRADQAEDGNLVLSATDITSLRNTERLLRQRAVAVENASDGIAIADARGRVIYANPSLARLLGAKDEGHLVGRKWRSFYTDVPTDVPDSARVSDGGGTLMALKTTSESNLYHEISSTLADKVGEVVVIRNATARVLMLERQQELNKQLERSRRREAISQLAAGLAHDFNNLLSAINGSATLIGMEGTATPAIRDHASRIGRAGNQAARLVNTLLDLGAAGENDSVFDLRAVVAEAEELIRASLDTGVTLRVEAPPEALLIRGQTGDLSQVLVNLFLNANDAYEGAEGTVEVLLKPTMGHDTDMRVGDLRAGRAYARLSVRDQGCGMMAETQERVFEPYFSTKGSAGTGVGLPMVATIVERAGGAIDLSSTVAEGTTFTIYWPLDEREETCALSPEANSDLSGHTILLLDDEPQVMEVLGAYLEEHGAEAVAISHPELAIETLLEDGGAWSALITDYDMPELTGGDVVHQLRNAGCTVPIYVATALARRLKDPRINGQTVSEIFAKPLNLRELVQRLAEDLPQKD
ncbi:PAS domain-containing protein [Tateyamaria sp. syn59]|uniref:hybrid sensor histidine kinase/response regulator n=1 Tax=Tateyamaria sp. syn59 TaxID=2576942 RepID=UPI0011BE94C9|nr:PAS domain-containing protein [Tateyamaria sp. syn59]